MMQKRYKHWESNWSELRLFQFRTANSTFTVKGDKDISSNCGIKLFKQDHTAVFSAFPSDFQNNPLETFSTQGSKLQAISDCPLRFSRVCKN